MDTYLSHICQGYVESPAVYQAAVKCNLEDLQLPGGRNLLQYADDLLIEIHWKSHATLTPSCSWKDSLNAVIEPLWQNCQPQVTYLGHVLKNRQHLLSPERVKLLNNMPPPKTKKDMVTFLVMANYCRHWIFNYTTMDSWEPQHCSPHCSMDWEYAKIFSRTERLSDHSPSLGSARLSSAIPPACTWLVLLHGSGILVQKHGSCCACFSFSVAYFEYLSYSTYDSSTSLRLRGYHSFQFPHH